jgi:F-type H+-transporting ATPase subunit c
MSRSRLMLLSGLLMLGLPTLAAAQEPAKAWQTIAFAHLAAGIGAGLTIIGGAAGIGRLAAAALEGIARQPNAAGDIRGAMIVAAGLIEGVTFFALIVTILLAIKA